MDRFVSFDGTGIAYMTAGSGPDVLLLHGFAADHEVNWVAPGVVDALLAAGRRVIALDARGHRQSDKPHDPAAYEDDAMERNAATPAAKTRLDEIKVPTMVIVGHDDALAGSPEALAERIPGAIARTVKGSHLGAVADPAFRTAITESVTGVSTT